MKLDFSPIFHGIVTFCIMIILYYITNNMLIGAFLAIGIFIGREHSEAEYRWMDMKNLNRTGKETIGAFNPKVWNVGSIMDLVIPILVAIITYKYF